MEHTQPLATEKTKAEGVLDAPATANEITTKKQDTTTKNHAMITAFINVGLRGLNRFQAAKYYHDTVLNSTIPILQKKYGVYFSRESEVVPNFTGGTTRVTRYWLDEVNMGIAIAALKNAGASHAQ